MEQSKNIVDLNSYVLDLIFSQLDELKDQLNLARAHSILEDAFVFHNRHRFVDIDIDNEATPSLHFEDWRFALSLCGREVKNFQLDASPDVPKMIKLVQQLCPNVEGLCIEISRNDVDNIGCLLLKMKFLKLIAITITEPNGTCDPERAIFESLQQLKHLKKLYLTNFDADLTSYYVSNLVKLTDLSLNAKQDDEIDVLKICKSMKRLSSLQLSPCHLTTQSLSDLAVKCPLLEELVLDKMLKTAEIPYFPKLKYLYVSGAVHQTSSLFNLANSNKYRYHLKQLTVRNYIITDWKVIGILRALTELCCAHCVDSDLEHLTQMKQLECMSLPCSPITNKALLRILRGCKKMRCLDITFCYNINEAFVYAALKILRENGVQPEQPFVLMAHKSGIDSSISIELSQNQDAKLLEITFEEHFVVSHMN